MESIEKTTLKNLTSSFGSIPECHNEFLQSLGKPHIDSFNYMLNEGLKNAVDDLLPVEANASNSTIKFWISNAIIKPPAVPSSISGVQSSIIWPTECRQRAASYSGRLIVIFEWEVDGVRHNSIEKDLGNIPIMLKSDACHLKNLSPAQLVKRNEHTDEWGGYFIIKGYEKLIRMLMMTRRNYPITVKRSTWKQRGRGFSDLGVLIRCVKQDQTATNNVLHFVTDGSVKLMFSYQKNMFYAPLILMIKCLVDLSDEAIYKKIMEGYEEDLYMKSCVLSMLRSLHLEQIHSQADAKDFIGKTFLPKFTFLPSNSSHEEISDFIMKRCLLIHLDNFEDKWNCLVFMTQKLFHLVGEKNVVEGVDGVMMQELLMGGHLYLQVLKERLQLWLYLVKSLIMKKTGPSHSISVGDMNVILKRSGVLESYLESFLSTGSIRSQSGLGLLQESGLSIIVENINRMRYMAHFKSVHRGSFFQEMRTTEARQLLPDAWGFICPVHTPDGSPCGLLNHLTKECQVTDAVDGALLKSLPSVLASLGMIPLNEPRIITNEKCYTALLDGRVIGRISQNCAVKLVDKLRMYKIEGVKVPKTLEIVLVPFSKIRGQHPGLFLFTNEARMMRPVLNLAANKVELIGTFEQVYLDICITRNESYKGITTHQELSKTSFLSNLASLIPMPDCNQSPRNMYQCQMGKQTMGTPCHNFHIQSETKLYRIQTPSSPLFRPRHYDLVKLDDFAMGTNAVVAVISYTGYDMEDAMIINKASLERGFAFGSIYKAEVVELTSSQSYFALDPTNASAAKYLEEDGLPFPGQRVSEGQPFYSYFDYDSSKYVTTLYKSSEEMVVDQVKLCGSFPTHRFPVKTKAIITYRVPRKPNIGDKFASRAGQKGICSQTLPCEDLPFTESGIVPDIVFNPHGFPSRMTIAMMIECMAGKSAATHGLVHDATPFEFSEDDTAIDYFGKLLHAGGFNYFGTERMYSGINGCEMTANIFFGIVYYQRLRHMVSDKWQVRSTGPTDILTHQPVKGRRRGGGVRFGEMERDSLISHGASFLLQDRLFHCSDKSLALVCRTCGTLLGPVLAIYNSKEETIHNYTVECRLCGPKGSVEKIEIPHVFKYLVTQLAAVNIKVQLQLDSP